MPSSTAADTILIIDVAEAPTDGAGGRPIHARGLSTRVVKATERAVDDVRKNMTQFMRGVQEILAEGAQLGGDFQVETVEINAQITASGQIGFAGTGMNLQGGTGLKMVFKRRKGGELEPQPPVPQP